MRTARSVRPVWVLAGLALGFAVVIAGPVALFWDALAGSPWNQENLRAEFQSIRYESGGLVFRYSVRNLTRHTARFQPTLTEIHALQSKDRPTVGYPNVLLPFDVPGRGSHVLEVRLELPTSMRLPDGATSEEHTRQVMQTPPTGATIDPESAVSPLPVGSAAGQAAPGRPAREFSIDDALIDLDGFELVDETGGIRLVLPRGW